MAHEELLLDHDRVLLHVHLVHLDEALVGHRHEFEHFTVVRCIYENDVRDFLFRHQVEERVTFVQTLHAIERLLEHWREVALGRVLRLLFDLFLLLLFNLSICLVSRFESLVAASGPKGSRHLLCLEPLARMQLLEDLAGRLTEFANVRLVRVTLVRVLDAGDVDEALVGVRMVYVIVLQ